MKNCSGQDHTFGHLEALFVVAYADSRSGWLAPTAPVSIMGCSGNPGHISATCGTEAAVVCLVVCTLWGHHEVAIVPPQWQIAVGSVAPCWDVACKSPGLWH